MFFSPLFSVQNASTQPVRKSHSALIYINAHSRELLHTKKRQVDTCERLNAVLGDSCISCELQMAEPEYEGFQQGYSSLPSPVAEELFGYKLSNDDRCSQALAPDLTLLKKANITMDNSLSPAYTLLQINCVDQKCLFYDIMRTLKDCNIKVSSSRVLFFFFDQYQ